MIELNLIPDVKQELIKAQRSRALVISAAVLLSIAAGAVVTLLALYVFGAQTIIINNQKNDITDKDQALHQIDGLEQTLTIQNQLETIVALHNDKGIYSRLFSVLEPIKPAAPNDIKISKVTLDSAEGTIQIEAQATGGYQAFETFKKTLAATTFTYNKDSKDPLVKADTTIEESGVSTAKNEAGADVLQFSVKFTYTPELFARESTNVKVKGPTLTNATDSFRGLPKDLFTSKATSQEQP